MMVNIKTLTVLLGFVMFCTSTIANPLTGYEYEISNDQGEEIAISPKVYAFLKGMSLLPENAELSDSEKRSVYLPRIGAEKRATIFMPRIGTEKRGFYMPRVGKSMSMHMPRIGK